MSEPKSIHATEDWGVVLQSVPSKNKKEITKRLEEIFELEKRDAEQILANMPLILVDNISFGLAARIKKFFQKIGAVTETTNHDMIKKNCFQVAWPQMPDLSFFMKNETGPSEAPAEEKKGKGKTEEIPTSGKKSPANEMKTETPKAQTAPLPERQVYEAPTHAAPPPPALPKVAPEPPAIAPNIPPVAPKPAEESPANMDLPYMIPDEKPQAASPSGIDSDWERRAKELNEKLRKIQDEKQQLHEKHIEVAEKVKNDYQQQLDQEKQKSDEIAKAYEDLRVQAQQQEALTKEGEEWRSKAVALGDQVRDLETDLMQKKSAIEHLIQQKDDLSKQANKASELAARAADLERTVAAKDEEKSSLQGRISDFEKNISTLQRELENYRSREKELSQKAGSLEHELLEKTESLRSRDAALAQFEAQLTELAEKAHRYESLRQEHAQLVQERATIRQEYDAKLVEQEVRLAKIEEEHRRHRSRVDRKTAAATRELGEWIRGVDTIRQGLQKLILFLGSEAAVLDSEKKSTLRSPLTRGPDAPNPDKA